VGVASRPVPRGTFARPDLAECCLRRHSPHGLASDAEHANSYFLGPSELGASSGPGRSRCLATRGGVPGGQNLAKGFGLNTASSHHPKDSPFLAVQMTRDATGVITSIDESITDLLGWRPEVLLGSPSTTLIHPADQPGAVAVWVDMIKTPGSTRTWRGRYKTAQGSWKWVETENQCRDGEIAPVVVSSMKAVGPEAWSLEEQLQAREHLLTQLSDALPVGVFQVDLEGHVTLTNQSFHLIVGVAPRESFCRTDGNRIPRRLAHFGVGSGEIICPGIG
jgi:PAS domain S-box-containing protein